MENSSAIPVLNELKNRERERESSAVKYWFYIYPRFSFAKFIHDQCILKYICVISIFTTMTHFVPNFNLEK